VWRRFFGELRKGKEMEAGVMPGTNGSALLFSESPTGILILDRSGRIVDINPAGCEAFGRPLARLQATNLEDWINPGDRHLTGTRVEEILAGKTADWNTRIRRGDGLPRIQRVQGVALRRNEEIEGALLFLRDLEEDGQGRPETRQLLSFIQTIPGQFILTMDKAGTIRYSAGLERTHFRASASMLGRPYRELLGGERDGEQNLDELLEEVGAGRPWAGLQWQRRTAGGSFPARVFATPHRDPKTGQVLGVIVVGQDDSASHRWRDQAERAEPLAQIGSLSSGIAQKLAEALTELGTTVDELESRDPKAESGAGKIRSGIAHFHRFLEAIAEFGDRGTIRRQPTPLPETLSEAMEELRDRIQSLELRPRIHVTDDLPPVYADRNYLRRILEVLLENALDAAEDSEEPFLEVEMADGPDGVVLRLTNSSPVVPEEWLAEIFDPFFTTKEGRPGLGLAVAQGMVRAHDGRLWAQIPSPGVLSLSMELPREAPDRVREFRAVPLNLSRARSVLLLDEDEREREVTKNFLERVGYSVREAWSGRSALAQITSGQLPEIVVADVRVSDQTGFWFLEQMERVTPRLIPRTVILVGDTEHEAAEEVAAETGCPVLRKPLDPRQFLEVLDQVAMGP
jgi:PAS domain S-box-containing protein